MNLLDSRNKFERRDYLKVLTNRKWYFLIPLILIVPLALIKIITTKPSYESFCLVEIERSNLLSSGLQHVVPGVTILKQGENQNLHSHIINTNSLRKLISELELNENPRIRSKAAKIQESSPHLSIEEIVERLLIERLKKDIKVKIFYSNLVRITAVAETPEMAVELVTLILDSFIEETMRLAADRVSGILEFSTKQVEVYRKKLETMEQRLERVEGNLLAKDVSSNRLNTESLERIKEAIMATDIFVREKRDYLNQVDEKVQTKRYAFEFPEIIKVKKIEGDIAEGNKRMAEFMSHYSSNSARVININRGINELLESAKSEFEDYFKRKDQTIDEEKLNLLVEKAITFVELRTLNDKKRILNNLIERFKRSAAINPGDTYELEKLKEEVKITRKIYNMFQQQSQGTAIVESIHQAERFSKFRMVERPFKPIEPTNASARVIFLLGMVISTGMGVGLVFGVELYDKSLKTIDETESEFKLPILAVIPHIENPPDDTVKRTFKFAAIYLIILIVLCILYKMRNTILTDITNLIGS